MGRRGQASGDGLLCIGLAVASAAAFARPPGASLGVSSVSFGKPCVLHAEGSSHASAPSQGDRCCMVPGQRSVGAGLLSGRRSLCTGPFGVSFIGVLPLQLRAASSPPPSAPTVAQSINGCLVHLAPNLGRPCLSPPRLPPAPVCLVSTPGPVEKS